MTTTDAASRTLATARQRIDQLAAQAQEHHETLAAIKADPTLHPDYKAQLRTEERERFNQVHREAVLGTKRDLEAAQQLALQRLSTVGEPDPRAAARVSRLIDGGMAPLLAAEVLADAGDVAGLRELRDQLPSLVTLTLPTTEQRRRPQVIEQALLAVDRRMAPLLSGDDSAAAQVRLNVDRERARLDATSEHAFNNNPGSLLKLALANAPEPSSPPSSGLSSAAHAG